MGARWDKILSDGNLDQICVNLGLLNMKKFGKPSSNAEAFKVGCKI